MHLKFDWGRLYFLIIPALVLATLLVIVLLPDIVLAWHNWQRNAPMRGTEPVEEEGTKEPHTMKSVAVLFLLPSCRFLSSLIARGRTIRRGRSAISP